MKICMSPHKNKQLLFCTSLNRIDIYLHFINASIFCWGYALCAYVSL